MTGGQEVAPNSQVGLLISKPSLKYPKIIPPTIEAIDFHKVNLKFIQVLCLANI